MTVAEVIAALQAMPQDAEVHRDLEWTSVPVYAITYDERGGHGEVMIS